MFNKTLFKKLLYSPIGNQEKINLDNLILKEYEYKPIKIVQLLNKCDSCLRNFCNLDNKLICNIFVCNYCLLYLNKCLLCNTENCIEIHFERMNYEQRLIRKELE